MVNTELLARGRGGGYSQAGDREGRQDGQKGCQTTSCVLFICYYSSGTQTLSWLHLRALRELHSPMRA